MGTAGEMEPIRQKINRLLGLLPGMTQRIEVGEEVMHVLDSAEPGPDELHAGLPEGHAATIGRRHIPIGGEHVRADEVERPFVADVVNLDLDPWKGM